MSWRPAAVEGNCKTSTVDQKDENLCVCIDWLQVLCCAAILSNLAGETIICFLVEYYIRRGIYFIYIYCMYYICCDDS
jgi:hypothetical protein